MSETSTSTPSEDTAPKKKTWFKTIVGSVFALVSGAVMTFVSPLLQKVAKPPTPVANFGHVQKGLEVTFTNSSIGGGKSGWDYGDGSALEFLPASQITVTHTYPNSGTFPVKLTVSNFLGEQNERKIDLVVADTHATPGQAGPAPAAKPKP